MIDESDSQFEKHDEQRIQYRMEYHLIDVMKMKKVDESICVNLERISTVSDESDSHSEKHDQQTNFKISWNNNELNRQG
jgi:hypothetical protein